MSAFRVASRRATQLSSLHQRGSLGIRPSGQVLLKSRPAASPALQSARWYSTGKAEQASTSAESDRLDGSGSKKEASQEEKKSEDKSQVVDEAHSKALEAKDGEITRLKEGLMKTLADFENLQKTTSRDMATAKEFAIQKFAQDLIGSVDVLELAIDAASKPAAESASESTSAFDTLLEGVKMTQSNLEKTLNRHGVSKFSPLGEKFDPNRHEALFQVPSSAAGPEHNSPNTVMNVQKTGWMFKNRTLRAAQVGVVMQE